MTRFYPHMDPGFITNAKNKIEIILQTNKKSQRSQHGDRCFLPSQEINSFSRIIP
jgi:hypothetical protein